ncbi:MAG: hypothetical protein H6658_07590 [Ardenticatenaceae bacterium]|nr:hypothetical protein [Ardenticatenaceae bacterium]
MNDERLMNYFDFTSGDLRANQNGELSARQTAVLRAESKSINRTMKGLGIILIGGSRLFLLFFWYLGLFSHSYSLCGSIGCLVPILMGGFFLRTGLRRTGLTLNKATGIVNIVLQESYDSERGSETYHVLHVGEAEFRVGSEVASLLRQGEQITIYYIDEWDRIISLERVSM